MSFWKKHKKVYQYRELCKLFNNECHLKFKSAQVFMDLNFKSAHLILDLLSYP